ncbi:MAG: 3-deoxy-D-manno-octulosonic acid transferase [Parachlamydiales bacterium]|nr:3-deoxy-D-manno-octulosonic acid transferase [Parachlamydiales bacterium]
MTLFSCLYTIGLYILGIVTVPKMLWSNYRYGKYSLSFSKKWGRDFKTLDKGQKKCLWVHAVSVGEIKAIASLANQLIDQNDYFVVVTTCTETGWRQAQLSIPKAHHLFLPYDFPYIIRPIVKRLKPDLVLLSETDFWYHFQNACKKVGAKIVLVNGKISERSYKRYKILKLLLKPLLNDVDKFLVQNEEYAKRFIDIGVPENKIVVTGNIKLEAIYPKVSDLDPLRHKFCIQPDDLVVTIASTHPTEEELFIPVMKQVWKEQPQVRFILVPRHPERCPQIKRLLDGNHIEYSLWNTSINEKKPLILIESMGQLLTAYQLSTLAIVAGSFCEGIGGHNVLEPIYYGVPTLFGPQMWGQKDFAHLAISYKSGLSVPIESMASTLILLLKKGPDYQTLTNGGKSLFSQNQGAVSKSLNYIKSLKI